MPITRKTRAPRIRTLLPVCALTAALMSATGPLAAQSVEEATPLLESGERDQVEAGIQMLGLLGTEEAVPPLVERIKAGLPPDLLDAAILTLGAIGNEAGSDTLIMLSRHRRPEVRVGAIGALAVVGGAGAYDALIVALGDADDSVRSAAAEALGALGDGRATPMLFKALDKGNASASNAIGKLTPSDDVPRLLTYVGKLPFYHLSPALQEVLVRKDVKEPAKLNVIQQVAALQTSEARRFLTDAVAAHGKEMGQRVSRAALRAAQEVPQ